MIDDSLVRGTTAGPLVKLVRDAGASEVHVRITCPPIMHPCHFGVDMGHDGDLMSARLDVDEIRDPHRRRQPGVPVAGRDDAGDRLRRRGDVPATATPASRATTRSRSADAQSKLAFEGVLA